MSYLDIEISADNKCAYEQGWGDALAVVTKKLMLKRDKLIMPSNKQEQEYLSMLNMQIATIDSVKDMQTAIAWAQDQGMFSDE